MSVGWKNKEIPKRGFRRKTWGKKEEREAMYKVD
jgi:hypothetical protein